MLILALVLVIVAAVLFAVEFARGNFATLTSLGLALFAGGLAAYLFWVGDQAGKF
jgi:hypothetical protein